MKYKGSNLYFIKIEISINYIVDKLFEIYISILFFK